MNDIIFAFSAFTLGALHALEPGHGKTVVAAYLVGSKGRVQDAVALGGIVTFTHTFSIIVLGVLTALAAAYFVPETVHNVLEVVSGLLIVGVGLWMVNDRIIKGRSAHGHSHGHEHPHEHPHEHVRAEGMLVESAVAHSHEHGTHTHAAESAPEHHHHHEPESTSGHSHDHGSHDENSHDHASDAHHGHSHALPPGEKPSLGSLITLGVSVGIVPCPAALALLLAAVAAGNFIGGVSLVVVFSLGLALVLIAIGVAMVKAASLAGRLFGDRLSDGRLARNAGMVSAVVVTVLGLAMTARAILDVTGI